MTTKLTLCLLLTLSIGLAFGQGRNEWPVFGRDVSSGRRPWAGIETGGNALRLGRRTLRIPIGERPARGIVDGVANEASSGPGGCGATIVPKPIRPTR
jgi:hypothetical protein